MPRYTTVWATIQDNDEQTWDINVECQISDRILVDYRVTYVEDGCPLSDDEIASRLILDSIEAQALENVYG